MKNNILKVLFIIWIILWVFFNVREVFLKSNLHDYKMLLSASLEEKRAYVTGNRLYEFLVFCNSKLPPEAAYRWLKTDKEELARRKATYYLYPHLEAEDAPFLLIYDNGDVLKNGYSLFAALDNNRYILEKMEGHINWK